MMDKSMDFALKSRSQHAFLHIDGAVITGVDISPFHNITPECGANNDLNARVGLPLLILNVFKLDLLLYI